EENTTALERGEADSGRYRIAYQSKIYVTDNVYATIDINKLSDSEFLEDFEPALYSNDPQPDNFVALTKWNEDYTLTGIVRAQLNDFQGATERLPELALDIKRQPLFGSRFFYESETSASNLKRRYGTDDMELPDY